MLNFQDIQNLFGRPQKITGNWLISGSLSVSSLGRSLSLNTNEGLILKNIYKQTVFSLPLSDDGNLRIGNIPAGLTPTSLVYIGQGSIHDLPATAPGFRVPKILSVIMNTDGLPLTNGLYGTSYQALGVYLNVTHAGNTQLAEFGTYIRAASGTISMAISGDYNLVLMGGATLSNGFGLVSTIEHTGTGEFTKSYGMFSTGSDHGVSPTWLEHHMYYADSFPVSIPENKRFTYSSEDKSGRMDHAGPATFGPMTTTEINAISNPTEGMLVYDSSKHHYMFFTGSVWDDVQGSL